jgi:hypothetical protein
MAVERLTMPSNKSPEPTPIGIFSFMRRFRLYHIFSWAWFSFHTLGALATSLSITKMKTTSIKITLLILTLFAAVFGLRAADTLSLDVTNTPAFKAFLTNYVKAINSKERAKLNECINPKWVTMMPGDQKFSDSFYSSRF